MKAIYIYSLLILLIGQNIFANEKIKLSRSEKKISLNNETIIKFSGYDWVVKDSQSPRGPHKNYWNKKNVWVDKKGRLHLKLTKNIERNIWECAELQTTKLFGKGVYQWKIEGPINTLDKNIVLGLFNYSGNSEFDEMDIEFARWGHDDLPILNYTIWPAEKGAEKNVTDARDFSIKKDLKTTHRWTRDNSSLYFQSLHGFQNKNKNMFANKKWISPPTSISKLEMPVFMNLWLFKTMPPSNGKEVEIVIHEFKFTPL